jgi:hypothetical protein
MARALPIEGLIEGSSADFDENIACAAEYMPVLQLLQALLSMSL